MRFLHRLHSALFSGLLCELRVEAGRIRAFRDAVSPPSWRVQPGARRTVEVKVVRRVKLVQASGKINLTMLMPFCLCILVFIDSCFCISACAFYACPFLLAHFCLCALDVKAEAVAMTSPPSPPSRPSPSPPPSPSPSAPPPSPS